MDDDASSEDEMYAVDVDAQHKRIVYGGKSDSWSAMCLETQEILFCAEPLADSVVFTRFVPTGLVVATLNGEIHKYGEDFVETASVTVDGDISFIEVQGVVLYAATATVYALDMDLNIDRMFYGHRSEVMQVVARDAEVYTISREQIIVFKSDTTFAFRIMINNGACICTHVSLFCAQTDTKTVGVFFGKQKVREISVEGNIETIVPFKNNFLVGGEFNHILFISTGSDLCTYKVRFDEDVGGVSKISILGDWIVFSTLKSMMGYFKPNKDVSFVSTSVGMVFDFRLDSSFLVLGGERGVNLVLTEEMFVDA